MNTATLTLRGLKKDGALKMLARQNVARRVMI